MTPEKVRNEIKNAALQNKVVFISKLMLEKTTAKIFKKADGEFFVVYYNSKNKMKRIYFSSNVNNVYDDLDNNVVEIVK